VTCAGRNTRARVGCIGGPHAAAVLELLEGSKWDCEVDDLERGWLGLQVLTWPTLSGRPQGMQSLLGGCQRYASNGRRLGTSAVAS
jgi:hypothetical protein